MGRAWTIRSSPEKPRALHRADWPRLASDRKETKERRRLTTRRSSSPRRLHGRQRREPIPVPFACGKSSTPNRVRQAASSPSSTTKSQIEDRTVSRCRLRKQPRLTQSSLRRGQKVPSREILNPSIRQPLEPPSGVQSTEAENTRPTNQRRPERSNNVLALGHQAAKHGVAQR